MRVRPNGFRNLTTLSLFALAATSAFATSSGKSLATKASVCAVSAKFVSTKFYHGKLLWIFDRLNENGTRNCGTMGPTFEVLIPSGSRSAISNANVYPISITEPKAGEEVDLHLESVKFKTGDVHWLLAGDSDAYRVKR